MLRFLVWLEYENYIFYSKTSPASGSSADGGGSNPYGSGEDGDDPWKWYRRLAIGAAVVTGVTVLGAGTYLVVKNAGLIGSAIVGGATYVVTKVGSLISSSDAPVPASSAPVTSSPSVVTEVVRTSPPAILPLVRVGSYWYDRYALTLWVMLSTPAMGFKYALEVVKQYSYMYKHFPVHPGPVSPISELLPGANVPTETITAVPLQPSVVKAVPTNVEPSVIQQPQTQTVWVVTPVISDRPEPTTVVNLDTVLTDTFPPQIRVGRYNMADSGVLEILKRKEEVLLESNLSRALNECALPKHLTKDLHLKFHRVMSSAVIEPPFDIWLNRIVNGTNFIKDVVKHGHIGRNLCEDPARPWMGIMSLDATTTDEIQEHIFFVLATIGKHSETFDECEASLRLFSMSISSPYEAYTTIVCVASLLADMTSAAQAVAAAEAAAEAAVRAEAYMKVFKMFD